MKTIRLCFSVTVLVALSVFFANLNPPQIKTSHVEAVQTPQVIKTVSKPAPVEKAKQTPAVAATVAPAAPISAPTSHEGMMQAAGIATSDWGAVEYIVSHESGWCATKWEGEYGACPAYHGVSDTDGYGICQSTPPGKMSIAGADWRTNPITQLKWCSMHADGYGGWQAAYNHWLQHHNW